MILPSCPEPSRSLARNALPRPQLFQITTINNFRLFVNFSTIAFSALGRQPFWRLQFTHKGCITTINNIPWTAISLFPFDFNMSLPAFRDSSPTSIDWYCRPTFWRNSFQVVRSIQVCLQCRSPSVSSICLIPDVCLRSKSFSVSVWVSILRLASTSSSV